MNPVTRRQLLALARRAARSAYCPYSGFHVGAALLAADGRIFTGANVENASYGLTLCAERTALFAAAAAGVRRVRGIAVTCPDAAADSAAVYRMPCGACRQVIAEFAADDLIIAVDGVADYRLDGLLPQAFCLPAPDRPAPPPDRPRLYLDIDNVLSDTDGRMRELIADVTAGRVRLEKRHSTQFHYTRCADGSGASVTEAEWRVVHDERFARPECVADLPPLPGAVDAACRLAGPFAVAYITGRPASLQASSQRWLADHGFPEGPVMFIGRGQKHLAIRGAFALVEDDREQAELSALDGMHGVILAHEWNHADDDTVAHRCADWPAVERLLADLAGLGP
ncbi:MAG: cytidine deaminase [Gemmataceae bacterium]